MKLDASLGTEGKYLRCVGETARAAESLGFAGLWTSETKHDAFLPLAIAANETERIELGTSIAVAFSRSPMEMAQTAWDLQDLSGGPLHPRSRNAGQGACKAPLLHAVGQARGEAA